MLPTPPILTKDLCTQELRPATQFDICHLEARLVQSKKQIQELITILSRYQGDFPSRSYNWDSAAVEREAMAREKLAQEQALAEHFDP